MTRELEYLEEALREVEAAARWYAERSVNAAAAFSVEIDAAESAIVRLPEAWPPYVYGTRRYLLPRFPFSVVYRIEDRRIFDRCGRSRATTAGVLEGANLRPPEPLALQRKVGDKRMTIGSGSEISVAAIAGVIPARRASRIDPIHALRSE